MKSPADLDVSNRHRDTEQIPESGGNFLLLLSEAVVCQRFEGGLILCLIVSQITGFTTSNSWSALEGEWEREKRDVVIMNVFR